jgi:hypothetical protein
MRLRLIGLTLLVTSLAFGTIQAATIAITEFEVDPSGADETAPEWIELFNYGLQPVDIGGWTLKDNATSIYTFPSGFTIPSGGYAIAARNRTNFINKWLGGVDDPRVAAGDTPFVMNNSAPGDGLYLRNASAELMWSLGYNITTTTDPISGQRATFLAINDFSENNYGEPPQHAPALINRNGTDGTGTLGYEDNNRTDDPFMRTPSPTTFPNTRGSPLEGHYTVIPEPAALLLFAIGGLSITLLPRRR